jgi:hypothetical protein
LTGHTVQDVDILTIVKKLMDHFTCVVEGGIANQVILLVIGSLPPDVVYGVTDTRGIP